MGFFPSTSVADSEYLLTRSTVEATLAAKARTEQAAAAHHKIASCYLAKLFGQQDTASPAAELVSHQEATSDGKASRSCELRFADLTPVPENDELTRILDRLD